MLLAFTLLTIYLSSESLAKESCFSRLRALMGVFDQAGREAVITNHSGQEFALDVFGKTVKGHFQEEFERRVNLPSGLPVDLAEERSYFDPAQKEWVRIRKRIDSQRDLVADLLDEFYIDERASAPGLRPTYDTNLSLYPLKTDAKHFHLNGPRPESLKLMHDTLTEEVAGKTQILNGPTDGDGNGALVKYTVGRQHEESVYYDTSTKELERARIAVRVKTWRPFTSSGEVSTQITGRSVFLKVTQPSNGLFTSRLEYMVPLDPSTSKEQLDIIIAKLVEKIRGNPIEEKVYPSIMVSNIRYGMDVVWRTGLKIENQIVGAAKFTRNISEYQKIGFLTVDRFASSARGKETPFVAQLEFELLPEFRNIYEMNPEKFAKFFDLIEKRYGAQVDTTPKYIQGNRLLGQ